MKKRVATAGKNGHFWRGVRGVVQGIGALGLLAWAGVASAEPKVVVLSAPEAPERPGFVEALRIQLAGVASVERAGSLAPGTQSERVEAAADAAERAGATLGVWVEGPFTRADGGRELVVHVVGKARGRAVIEVVRTPAERSAEAPDPAVDRSLALKVRALVGDLAAPRGVLDATVVPERSAGEASAVSAEAARGAAPRARVEVGALAAVGSPGVRAGAHAGAGARLAWAPFGMELVARIEWLEPANATSAVGTVEVTELVPGLELRGDVHAGDLRLGALLGTELRALGADGTTRRGVRGSARMFVPAVLTGPYLALPLGHVVEVRLVLALALALREEHLALSGVSVVDTERLRANAGLLLGAHLP